MEWYGVSRCRSIGAEETNEKQLAPCHLLSRVEQQLAVRLAHAGKVSPELSEHSGLFAGSAPGGLVSR